MTDFTRSIRLHAGHNCRDFECRRGDKRCYPGGPGDHGIHGLTMAMYLRGPKGTIHFEVYFLDVLPGCCEHGSFKSRVGSGVMAAGLRIHAVEHMWDGHEKNPDCPFVDGGVCYNSMSFTGGDVPLEILAEHGDEEVWRYLEMVYAHQLEGAGEPITPPTKLVPR